MAQDNVSKIKDRLSVVDVVGGYLKLQKAGINFKARCPFHNEKTGSFFISPTRQIWHCFGCGLGGDMFSFIERIEGIEFKEALRILAGRAGVEIRASDPNYSSERNTMLEINELAAKFYEKQLGHSFMGAKAMTYLHERGLTDESIENFRLGYAPNSWQALYDFLAKKFSIKELTSAGLTIAKDGGKKYDRFRSRIMFPISDLNGRVVAFSGRIFGNEQGSETAKYVNSPQTSIYDKSRIIYGLHQAKMAVRQADRSLVVEGNMDVVMSHQAGVQNAVASSGTALTVDQIKILKRYSDSVDLCFDADSAGALAIESAVVNALAQDMTVSVIAIDGTQAKDPADIVKDDPAKWQAIVAKTKPFMEYYFDRFKEEFDLKRAEGKKQFTRKVFPLLASISNDVEKAHWISEASYTLRVSEEVIKTQLAKVQRIVEIDSTPESPHSEVSATDLSVYEESLLALVIKKPSLKEKLDNDNYVSERIKTLASAIMDSNKQDTVIADEASTAKNFVADFAYLKSEELWQDFSEMELEREFDNLLNYHKRSIISGRLTQLEYEIKEAEKNGDIIKRDELSVRFADLSKEIN